MRTIHFSPMGFFAMLAQCTIGRVLMGGLYVKMNGCWYSSHTRLVLRDGTRILSRDDEKDVSFHETFIGIENIKEYV